MGRILVSFLGRWQAAEGGGYRTAAYRFADGFSFLTSYFAEAALAYGRHCGRPYSRFLVMGTAGSSWDDAAVRLGGLAADDGFTVAIGEKVSTLVIDQRDLDALSRKFSERLGMPVECILIGDCRTVEEARRLVSLLAQRIGRGELLHLDISHAYRHLPLLTLFAGLTLEGLGGVRIERIWNGALELSPRGRNPAEPPVLELAGILSYYRWVKALAALSAGAGLTEIGRLLEEETGVRMADDLNAADFQMRILAVAGARPAVSRLLKVVDESSGPVLDIFRPELKRRLAWAGQPDLARQQAALAWVFLKENSFLEAAIIGREAVISRLMTEAGTIDPERLADAEIRRQQEPSLSNAQRLNRRSGGAKGGFAQSYFDLLSIRNALAHSQSKNKASIQKLISSPRALHDTLAHHFRILLPKIS